MCRSKYPHTRVALEYPHILPPLLPVPKLDGHVITGGKDERLCRVDHDRADVIGVRLEGSDLLARVVVVNADLAVAQRSVPASPWK